jgi:uncharacterized protein with NRDE domain
LCLIGLALDAHPRWPLVIAANRDEHFDRATAPLDWWRTSDDAPWLLGGRDLVAGGTWLALSEHGRIGALTNVRDPARQRRDAASRGVLVTAWLEGGRAAPPAQPVNPFNLLGGELQDNRWWWLSDPKGRPTPIGAGVHAVSNGAFDEPWPKVRLLRQALQDSLAAASDDEDALLARLFGALGDRRAAPDADLPDTGVGLERERWLSPAFIAARADARYGTRSSIVLLGSRDTANRWQLRIVEHTHDRAGAMVQARSVALDDWPRAGHRPPVSVPPLS